jgi:hypothetical protein
LVSAIVAYYLYPPFIQSIQSTTTGENQAVRISTTADAATSRDIQTAAKQDRQTSVLFSSTAKAIALATTYKHRERLCIL